MKKLLLIAFCGLLINNTLASSGDSIKLSIKAWKINLFNLDKINEPVDTNLNLFHLYNPVYKKSFSSSYLGNFGLAAKSNILTFRQQEEDFIFITPYNWYIFNPKKIVYFNTTKPYSDISYTSNFFSGSDAKEQSISVLHSQNINPNLNIGLNYRLISSMGQYDNQITRNYALNFFSSFNHRRYDAYFNFNMNKISVQHNGGIADDSFITDSSDIKPSEIPINFETDVNSVIYDRHLYFAQELKLVKTLRPAVEDNNLPVDSLLQADSLIKTDTLMPADSIMPFDSTRMDTAHEKNNDKDTVQADSGKTNIPAVDKYNLSLVHFFSYKKNYHAYYDDFNDSTAFYPDVYFANSPDSQYYRSLRNSIGARFLLPVLRLRGLFYFTNELQKYYFMSFSDGINIMNNYVSAELATYQSPRWNYNFSANYCLNGYKANDIKFNGVLAWNNNNPKDLISVAIKGKSLLLIPSYFENHLYSKHFSWENDFKKINTNALQLTFERKKWNLKSGIDFRVVTNFLYYDTNAIPAQLTKPTTITSFYLQKKFKLWKFHSLNKLIYQTAGDESYIRLPRYAFYNSSWFEQLIKFNFTGGRMLVQIGFDVYYHAKFKGYAFMPATSRFYFQNEKKLGGHPFLDGFLNVNIKKFRLFIKLKHINSDFGNNPDYFSVLHYPRNPRSLRVGISWTFYN